MDQAVQAINTIFKMHYFISRGSENELRRGRFMVYLFEGKHWRLEGLQLDSVAYNGVMEFFHGFHCR